MRGKTIEPVNIRTYGNMLILSKEFHLVDNSLRTPDGVPYQFSQEVISGIVSTRAETDGYVCTLNSTSHLDLLSGEFHTPVLVDPIHIAGMRANSFYVARFILPKPSIIENLWNIQDVSFYKNIYDSIAKDFTEVGGS